MSAALELDLAYAVAKDLGAMTLKPNNERLGWANIERAVRENKPYAVIVKPEILAVDYDQSNGIEFAMQAAITFEGLGILSVVELSGQEQRAHLWARIDTDELRSKAEEYCQAQGGDIRKGGKRMRPPGSMHRLGTRAEIVYPQSPELALSRLKGGSISIADALEALGRMLSNAPKAGSGQSSDHIFSMAAYAIEHSVPYQTWAELVESHPKVSRRSKSGKAEYLLATWKSAARKCKPREIPASLKAWLETKATSRIPIRLREALDHIERIAVATRKQTIYISNRQLAEYMGCSAPTAHRHLRQLVKVGWLKARIGSKPIEATEYKLTIPETLETAPQSTSPRLPSKRVFQNLTFLDAFSRKGICKEVYSIVFHSEAVTVAQIAGILGVSVEAVRHHIRWLEEHSLVRRGSRGLIRAIENPDYVAVAERRGTYGKAMMRAQRHANERASFKAFVEMLESKGVVMPQPGSYRRRPPILKRVESRKAERLDPSPMPVSQYQRLRSPARE